MSKSDIDIFYLCDGNSCTRGFRELLCQSGECKHTSDINHAIHKDSLTGRLFEYARCGDNIGFFEKEVPEKKAEYDEYGMDVIEHESLDLGRRIGWNECLDKLFNNSNDSVNDMEELEVRENE